MYGACGLGSRVERRLQMKQDIDQFRQNVRLTDRPTERLATSGFWYGVGWQWRSINGEADAGARRGSSGGRSNNSATVNTRMCPRPSLLIGQNPVFVVCTQKAQLVGCRPAPLLLNWSNHMYPIHTGRVDRWFPPLHPLTPSHSVVLRCPFLNDCHFSSFVGFVGQ